MDQVASAARRQREERRLVPEAQELASRLQAKRLAAAARRQQGADALKLVENTLELQSEGGTREEHEELEQQLQAFVKEVRLPDGAEAAGAEDVQERLDEIQAEVALLRRTLVAALSEVKEKVAELGPRGRASPLLSPSTQGSSVSQA